MTALLCAVVMLPSLRLAIGLWILPVHRSTRRSKRVFFTLLVLLPLAGPVFYGAFYRIPPVHRAGGRAPMNEAAFWGGSGNP